MDQTGASLPSGNRNYGVKREVLREHQAEVCRRLARGERPEVIAADLNITPQSVSNYMDSELGKEALALYRQARNASTAQVAQKMGEMQEPARQVVEELMVSGQKEEVRLKAAIYILGTQGHTPIQKTLSARLEGALSEDDMQKILGNAKDAGIVLKNKSKKNVDTSDE